MTQQYRCDSCGEAHPENKLIRIRAIGKTWFRCADCREDYREGEKLGDKPRSDWYYAQLIAGHVFGGWEDEDKVIRFNP